MMDNTIILQTRQSREMAREVFNAYNGAVEILSDKLMNAIVEMCESDTAANKGNVVSAIHVLDRCQELRADAWCTKAEAEEIYLASIEGTVYSKIQEW